jgi:hypothetical protein
MTLKIDRVPDSPKYVPSLVKIHWRMLILVFTRMLRSKRNWPGDLDLWPWKSIGFQILLRTKYMYVPSLVKTHWRMLILECSQGCYAVIFFDPVTLTVDLEKQYPTNMHIFKLGSGNAKLGTYLGESGTLSIFKVIDQRSRSPGQFFRRGDTPRFALPLLYLLLIFI